MPGGKRRLPGRFTAGLRVSSGSVVDRVTEIFAGSVIVTHPVFDAASSVGCLLGTSDAVTGLDASHLVLAIPASAPGDSTLISACCISDSLELMWMHTGSAAVAADEVTVQFVAFRTMTGG